MNLTMRGFLEVFTIYFAFENWNTSAINLVESVIFKRDFSTKANLLSGEDRWILTNLCVYIALHTMWNLVAYISEFSFMCVRRVVNIVYS